MLSYCTYCSAEKNTSETPLPAIERYRSSRILEVNEKAKHAGETFVILSGKYGILDAEQPIDHYDHLLIASEVEQHAMLVASQLKEKGITKLVFYTDSVLKDPNIQPYIDCISLATAKAGTTLEIIEFE